MNQIPHIAKQESSMVLTWAKSKTWIVAPEPYHHGPDIPYLYATALDCSFDDESINVPKAEIMRERQTDQSSGPRPCGYDTCSNEPGFDAPRRAVEFVCAFWGKAGVAGLCSSQPQHKRAEEETNACVRAHSMDCCE